MKKKHLLPREVCYFWGMYTMSLGTAFAAKADFGMSMVMAPAYVLSLKLAPLAPFFTFGFFSYTLQALMLICMILILKTAKRAWFFSFLTAFLIGCLIDANTWLLLTISAQSIPARIACFAAGMFFETVGVAIIYKTYFPLEIYDVVPLEAASRKNISLVKSKTVYDCVSCLLAVCLSFLLFGRLYGVSFGTVICALFDGTLIGFWGKQLDKLFTYTQNEKWQAFLQGEK